MENLLLPSKIIFEPGDKPNVSQLTLEPCYQGYGTTVGNALRRVLLSSLPGAAVTAVKIKGVPHEFSAIPGVLEDVLELTLNLKQLRLKVFSEEPVRLNLKAKGAKKISAGDIEPNAAVEIANPELHLATLTSDDISFEIEIFAERGRGFSSIEQRTAKAKSELGLIQIDALYSPVRAVGFTVENARVGEITDYDKLIMTIETDGTVTPEAAVHQSAEILLSYFSLLTGATKNSEIDADAPLANESKEA